MKTIVSTLAAALIASASFAGAALAGGDYYEGIWPNQDHKTQSVHQAPSGSYGYTGSISSAHQRANQFAAAPPKTVGSGDYYQGVNRPN